LLEEHDRKVTEQLALLEEQRCKVRSKIAYYRGAVARQAADSSA
jgi:hypothetical protein